MKNINISPNAGTQGSDKSSTTMTSQERRSSGALALIFALRMLGLFLVLPVFMLEARKYPGGDDPAMIGLAMGLYGLTQAVFQLPIGLASDRIGRKRVIVAGLLVFAAGSLIAAMADSLTGLMVGRAIQGAGAVSAAVTALLADLTRDGVRTKAMAMVGGSIGLMFALALVLAPLLNAWIGLSGIFGLTCALALAGIAVVLWVVPPEPKQHVNAPKGKFSDLLGQKDLLRLNFGVFILHTVQMSMGGRARHAGAGRADQGATLAYLSAGGAAVLSSHGHAVFHGTQGQAAQGLAGCHRPGAGGTDRPGHAGGQWHHSHHLVHGAADVSVLCGFNALEASQPSLVSRMAPAPLRGAALGAYNTLQSLGLFAGGAIGGAVAKFAGVPGLFIMTAVLTAVWLLVTWPLRPVGRHG